MSWARSPGPSRSNSRAEPVEQHVVQIDGGIGDAAIAAITVVLPGPARELELARWARIAASTGRLAYVVDDRTTDDEIQALAELSRRARMLRGSL